MRWEDYRRSDNVDDVRGSDESSPGSSFNPGGFNIGAGHLGIGTILVLGLIGWAFGIDPRLLIGGAEMLQQARQGQYQGQYTQPYNQPTAPRATTHANAQPDQLGNFISAVLAETEDVWSDILPAQKGIKYVPPHLVRFDGQTHTVGCGEARAAAGPFYCPGDRKIYLDTAFFAEMKRRLGGGGDFAYAYVIAHEVGHHVQDQLGILGKVQQAEENASSEARKNALSVRIELMADCLAGVWAANAQAKYHILEAGDVEKAINTAQAIGDDSLQQAAGRNPRQETFTHGSSAQRVQWLNIGLKSGQIDSCNTFANTTR
jgi:uncharacterized protein